MARPWERAQQTAPPAPPPDPVVTPDPSNAGAIIATTPPQPPPAQQGMTASAPINVALGGGLTGAVNTGVNTAAQDPMLSLYGIGLAFFFNWFKGFSWFQQQRHAHITLLLFGLLIGVVVIGVIGHEEMSRAIAKGCGVAANAWADYTGIKVGGLPGLPAAAPGSGFVNG